MNNQLKAAIKEIQRVKNLNKSLEDQIIALKNKIESLEASMNLVVPKTTNSIDHILRGAEEAMKRNVAKLRKEIENAKQEQSKRQ